MYSTSTILSLISLIAPSLASNVFFPPENSIFNCNLNSSGIGECLWGSLDGGAEDYESLQLGACGYNMILASWPTICIVIVEKGQGVWFSKGANYEDPALDGGWFYSAGTMYWCEWEPYQTNSVFLDCSLG
jgi:hypothetical protein